LFGWERFRGWLGSYALLNAAFEQSDQGFDYEIEDLPWHGDLPPSGHDDASPFRLSVERLRPNATDRVP
jgi:hypothetical protein